jgi:hypothetical protein
MFKVISYGGVITIVLLKALSATAVTLVEKDEWKVNLGGFVELDNIYDSTRSLPETLGNAPINRPSTVKGDTPQTQISVRHSRFSFTILAPNFNEWKSKAYLEMDFLGYNPSPSTSAPTNSESSFYTTPTMRLRHGYMALEKSGWTLLLGQSWSFFGWDPYYVLSTVSPSPPCTSALKYAVITKI